jgi:glucokinase
MNIIALDIGGTKISGAILTSDGMLRKRMEQPTEAFKGAEHILNVTYHIIEELMNGETSVDGIGIASAGRINVEEGSVAFATPNLPGWTGLHLKEIYESRYHIPVVIENDVNAAAIGEGWLGAARQLSSYVCITLGTGVGGAFAVNQKIWRGHHWSGAELGHLLLKAGGRPCNCGLSGCTEQYVSGTAIFNHYNELSGANVTSAAEVFRLAGLQDEKAMQVIEEFKKDLIDTILSCNNIFDPQGYVIGGGLLGAKEFWWDDVVNGVNKYKPTLLLSAELENQAGLAGAAKLVMDQINHLDLQGKY